MINWTSLSCEDQATILPTLQSTNNWIVLALAGKSKLGTIPLPIEGFITAMTTKGKSLRKGHGGGPNGHPPLPGHDIRHRRLTRKGQYGSGRKDQMFEVTAFKLKPQVSFAIHNYS